MVRAVGYHEDRGRQPRVEFVSLSFRFLLVVEIDKIPLGVAHLGAVLAVPQAKKPELSG